MTAHRPGARTDPPNQFGVSILADIMHATCERRHDYKEPHHTDDVMAKLPAQAWPNWARVYPGLGARPLTVSFVAAASAVPVAAGLAAVADVVAGGTGAGLGTVGVDV